MLLLLQSVMEKRFLYPGCRFALPWAMIALGLQPVLDGVSRVCICVCPVCRDVALRRLKNAVQCISIEHPYIYMRNIPPRRDVACYVSIIPSVGNWETLHATSLRGIAWCQWVTLSCGVFCLMVLSRRHNVTSLRVGCVGITISYRAASIATFWPIRLLIVSVEDY